MTFNLIRKNNSKNIYSSISGFSSDDTIVFISNDAVETEDKSKNKFHKRILRIILKILGWVFGIILFIILAYTICTVICNHRDNNILEEYDKVHSKKVDVNGHKMSYSIYGESNNVTIITLPPLGSISPIIELKTITEELSDMYRVITLEPFGYGFSDSVNIERTLENISSEYYEGAKKIGVDKYYLMAHSLGGIYALQWALDHSNDVLGFIGLDVSVPGQDEDVTPEIKQEYVDFFTKYNTLRRMGFFRFSSLFGKDFFKVIDPSYKNYSEEEKNIEKLLANNRSFSDNLINEAIHFYEHLEKVKDKKFPENIPVLNFVAHNNNSEPSWEKLHHDEISNSTHSEVISLEGTHYIYLDQKTEILKKIREWIN